MPSYWTNEWLPSFDSADIRCNLAANWLNFGDMNQSFEENRLESSPSHIIE